MRIAGDRGREWRFLRLALIASDFSSLLAAVVAASLLWPALDWLFGIGGTVDQRHLSVSGLVVIALLLLFRLNGLYDFDRILAGTREYARVANAVTYGIFAAIAVSFFSGGAPLISRAWLVLIWASSILFVCLSRFALRRVVRRLRRRDLLRTRVAIVGASSFGVAIARQLLANPSEGLELVGFIDEYVPLGQRLVDDISVIGRPADLVRGYLIGVADEFILVPEAIPHQHLEELTRLMVAEDQPVVRLAVSSVELLTNGILVAERASVPLLTLERARITGIDAFMKRALDISASLALTVLFLPFVLPAMMRALWSRPPSLLEREVLYGERGRSVAVYLFSREVSSSLPVRGWPALLAVLAGRVSLVGPRPVRVDSPEGVPVAIEVTAVKPGLIGPWRLAGPNSSRSSQTTRDLAYIRNYSIWEDFHVITESFVAMLRDVDVETIGRWQDVRENRPPQTAADTVNAGKMLS